MKSVYRSSIFDESLGSELRYAMKYMLDFEDLVQKK